MRVTEEKALEGEPPEAVLQQDSVEIHQQSNLAAAQTKIGEHLRLMKGRQSLYGFDLKDEVVFDENVNSITVLQLDLFIDYRQGHLLPKANRGSLQFKAQAFLISRLQ